MKTPFDGFPLATMFKIRKRNENDEKDKPVKWLKMNKV